MFRGKKLIEEVENPPTDAKERIELGLFDNSDDHVSQRIKKKKKKAARVCVSFLLKRNTHQGSWLVLLSAGPQEGALEATRLPWSQAQDPPGWKVDEIFSQESKSSHTWIVSKSLCSWMLFFWGAGARCAAYRILVPRPGIESVPRCHGRMGC